MDKLGDVNYRIVDKEGGTPKVVHYNRIKPYVARQLVIIPEWVRTNSKELAGTAKSTEVHNKVDRVREKSPKAEVRRLKRKLKVNSNKSKLVKSKPRRGQPLNAPTR